MEQKKEISSSLRFIDYIVNSVEFIYNHKFEEKPISIDFDIDKEIEYVESDNNILVTLIVKVFENASKNNYPFTMNLNVTGIFEVDKMDKEKSDSFAEVNAVAILFPYIRALITTYTSNSNVPPLILPPINVVKLMENKK
ncbi:protein-export chaperone SecB [Sutcliffiella horikoshii]|uniref:protein-export chaperone SecB n=1 Tax=Sutcliffiella horikoshii TaxID=79883 RepID=UPI003CF232E0